MKMKNCALLSSNLPSVIDRSHLSPSRDFYSNNDPTSPKGPRKQTTEQILGTALLEKKKQLQPVEWEGVSWLTASKDLLGNNA